MSGGGGLHPETECLVLHCSALSWSGASVRWSQTPCPVSRPPSRGQRVPHGPGSAVSAQPGTVGDTGLRVVDQATGRWGAQFISRSAGTGWSRTLGSRSRGAEVGPG